MPDRHLGDGVYASYDGYHIWLDLRGQDNVTRIALEPAVLGELNQYAQDISKMREAIFKAVAKEKIQEQCPPSSTG